jgi:hypothetical protein
MVQSGCYEFHIGGKRIEAGPETVIYAPHRVPHAFTLPVRRRGTSLSSPFSDLEQPGHTGQGGTHSL